MKALIFFIVLLPVSVSATLVSVDPDEFAAGTDISHAWAAITLSSDGGASGLDGKVYAEASSYASTGDLVFAHNIIPSNTSSKLWLNADTSNCYYLRVDFDAPISYVSIDFISDTGTDYPSLWYHTTEGILKKTQSITPLGTGQKRTLEVSRLTADIDYIRVGEFGTTAQYSIFVDNLRYEVPEPASFLLLLSAAALIRARKNKAKSL